MKVYFHSDDVCLSAESTGQILHCWSAGFLDGFSVFANKKYLSVVDSVLANHRSTPARISVHLNLTDLDSCLPHSAIPLLVTDHGFFRISFLKALLIVSLGGERKRKFLNQVYKEWDAQIELVKKNITTHEVSGLDSHNHVHMIPSLFQIVSQLADKHQIKHVRVPAEPVYLSGLFDVLKTYYLKNLIKWFVLRCLKVISKVSLRVKRQTAMGILYSGHMFEENVRKGIEIAQKKKIESLEVIFHIGQCDEVALKGNVSSASSVRFFTSIKRTREYNAVQNLTYERKGTNYHY